MAIFKIDKNIPPPDPNRERRRKPRKTKYPFRDMEVGSSVFIPDKTVADILPSIRWATMTLDRKYDYENEMEEGITGVRVWRVE